MIQGNLSFFYDKEKDIESESWHHVIIVNRRVCESTLPRKSRELFCRLL